MSAFLLIFSSISLFIGFLSFSISLVDGYFFIAIIQSSSLIIRYLSKETELQFFISSLILPFSLGLIFSSRIFIKKEINKNQIFIGKKYIKRKGIIISLLSLVAFLLSLFASSLSTGEEISGANKAFALSTQSPEIYAIMGIIRTYTSAYLLLIFLHAKKENIKNYFNILFLIVIPTSINFVYGLLVALKTSLFAYLTKALLPLLRAFELYFLKQLKWNNFRFKRLFTYQKISKSQLSLLIFLLFSFSSLALIFSFVFNSNILSAILFKISLRSEGYAAAFPKLDILHNAYKYNFLYFIHPFLKLIGTQAYDAPIGTFLDSGGDPIGWIGGPNIHFPLVIRILLGDGLLSVIFNFLFAFLIGRQLAISRNNVLFLNGRSNNLKIFSSIVLFQSFPLLFIEPSGWSHSMFFLFLIISLIVIFNNFSKSLARIFFYSN